MDIVLVPLVASAVTSAIAQALAVRELVEIVRLRKATEAAEQEAFRVVQEDNGG